MTLDDAVQLSDVLGAANRISGYVHRTPVLTSSTADELSSVHGDYQLNLLFKCENFQKVGAFKFRGATNAIRSLLESEDAVPNEELIVITHSSGNHAQALALAARQQNVVCHVVMPSNAPSVKKDAVRGYGAIVTECEPTLESRQQTVNQIVQDLESQGSTVEFISPYDDVRVIAGQGTLAIELMDQAEEMGKKLDILVTPIGGGGMLSGCAVAAKGKNPDIWVIGAEPKGADDAHRSFYAKELFPSIGPKTVADGLLTSLGVHTFPLILKHVDAIHTVSENEIIRATKFVFERMKIVIEPSSAVTLATVLYSPEFHRSMKGISSTQGGRKLNVGLVFSGGNVDLKLMVGLFDRLE